MFEDICIVCGKPLLDFSRAYCSDDCQTNDISSPSISSSSSARSSPNIICAYDDEVPALVPSALGTPLKSYGCNHYYVSSSSASSTLLTDEEDDEVIERFGSGFTDCDVSDGVHDGSAKSSAIPSGLSYARRPSGTNNSCTVPHIHKRRCPDSSCGSVRDIPRSVPIYSHSPADYDENYFDIGSLPEDALDTNDSDLLLEQDCYRVKQKYQGVQTSKRSRTRASLPACFSLLHMTCSNDIRSSPVLSSSGNAIAMPSLKPTTLSQAQFPPTAYSTPRGRGREAGTRRFVNSSGSGSGSRIKPSVFEESSRLVECSFRSRTDLEGSIEQLFDCPSVPGFPHRGRTTLRRNSSPLPKMVIDLEDPALVLSVTVRSVQEAERPGSRTRGRARVVDLGRDAHSTDAPGFVYGRSGLLDRERGSPHRLPF